MMSEQGSSSVFEVHRVEHDGGRVEIRLAGTLEFAGARGLWTELRNQVESAESEVVMDLSEVSRADGGSVALLLQLLHDLEARGAKTRIVGATEPVQRIIDLELRLQRVRSASHLKERIVHRGKGNELGFYEERRWSELPQDYLRRTLSEVLFVEHGIRRVTSGPSHNLEVELVSFSEVIKPEHKARVEIHVLLHDEGRAILEDSIVVERSLTDVEPGDSDAIAEALGSALREAVDRIANVVIAAL